MIKIGDRFKDKTTGKIYIIRMETDNDTVFLEGENGLGEKVRDVDAFGALICVARSYSSGLLKPPLLLSLLPFMMPLTPFSP